MERVFAIASSKAVVEWMELEPLSLEDGEVGSALLGGIRGCQNGTCSPSVCLCSSLNLMNFIIKVVMKAGVPATLLESRELGEETNWLGDNERPKTTFIVEFPLPSGKRSKVSDSLDNWKRFASGTLACGSVVVLKIRD